MIRQMSNSAMEVFTPSPNYKVSRSVPSREIEDIFNRLVQKCYSKLNKYVFIRPLKGDARRDFGDYACLSVLEVCEELRKNNPHLFEETTPQLIAQRILGGFRFEEPNMINQKSLRVHDAGIITFQLDGSWIAHRIDEMILNGIKTWAPMIYKRRARAVFVSTVTDYKSKSIRATWIKDALLHMFLYSGVDVLDADNGFLANSNISTSIRYGVRELQADIMVFMTPDLQREYIQECFTVARSFNWFRAHPAGREATLACCGYRSSDLGIIPADMWQSLIHQDRFTSLVDLASYVGYTPDSFLGCVLKYTLLKRHRLAEVTLKFEEMIDEEGNTFVNLLRMKAEIRKVIKNSKSPGILSTKPRALSDKGERELGLHLVEFTAVVEKACRGLVPDVVCEYLFDLSKLFWSYYREHGKALVGLCRATEVVMCECFCLLGIDPSSGQATSAPFLSLEGPRPLPVKETWANDDRYSRSRFELFTMTVSVPHPDFDEGTIFGNIWVKDAIGERSDGWTKSDARDCCFVSYFNHEWYKPLHITYGSCIPFGNPSCRRSVPVSSSFEVHVQLHALSKEKDQCYLIFHGKHDEPLSDFWDEGPKAECGTIKLESDIGRVLVNYALLKFAVDASMELTFRSSNPAVPVRIWGFILAYYGDGLVKDKGGIQGQYKAVIFRNTNFELRGEQGVLPLHKSLLAVPVNGCLKIEALLVDVESKKEIVRDTLDFRPRLGNADHNWCLEGGEYSFNFRVDFLLQ